VSCSLIALFSCSLAFLWNSPDLRTSRIAISLLFILVIIFPFIKRIFHLVKAELEGKDFKEVLLSTLSYFGVLVSSGGILLVSQALFFSGEGTRYLALIIISLGGILLSSLGFFLNFKLKVTGPGEVLVATGFAFLFISTVSSNLLGFISPPVFFLIFLLLSLLDMWIGYITSSPLVFFIPPSFALLSLLNASNLNFVVGFSALILLITIISYRNLRDRFANLDFIVPFLLSISGIFVFSGLRFDLSNSNWLLLGLGLGLLGFLAAYLLWLVDMSEKVRLLIFSYLTLSLTFALGKLKGEFYPLLFSLPSILPVLLFSKDKRWSKAILPGAVLLVSGLTRGMKLSYWLLWSLQTVMFVLILSGDQVALGEIILSLLAMAVSFIGYLSEGGMRIGYINNQSLFMIYSLSAASYVIYVFWRSLYFRLILLIKYFGR